MSTIVIVGIITLFVGVLYYAFKEMTTIEIS